MSPMASESVNLDGDIGNACQLGFEILVSVLSASDGLGEYRLEVSCT